MFRGYEYTYCARLIEDGFFDPHREIFHGAETMLEQFVGQRFHAAFTSTVSLRPALRIWSWSASLTN